MPCEPNKVVLQISRFGGHAMHFEKIFKERKKFMKMPCGFHSLFFVANVPLVEKQGRLVDGFNYS